LAVTSDTIEKKSRKYHLYEQKNVQIMRTIMTPCSTAAGICTCIEKLIHDTLQPQSKIIHRDP